MPILTLTRPNRLNLRGLIFDRGVATEVPIDVFRELYDTRKAQFDFSATGIALMVAASAGDPDPAPRAPKAPADAGPPKTGLIIRKSRRAKRDEPETPDPDLFDPDPADPADASPEGAEPEPAETGVDV